MNEVDVKIKFEPKKDGKRWRASGYIKNRKMVSDTISIELVDLISNVIKKTADSFGFKAEIEIKKNKR
jgi:hypothetical protein